MKKQILNWTLRIGVTAGLFVLLFTRFVDPQQVVAELAGVSVAWLVAAVVLQAAGVYSSIWRWNFLLLGQDLRLPHGHLVSTYLIGRFFGTFLPSTIGLDAYRTYDVARRANATTQSLAVLVVEKLIGFFALSLMIALTAPWGVRFLPAQVLGFIFAAFCIPVTLSFVLLLRPGLLLRLLDLPFPFKHKLEGRLRQAVDAVTVYRNHKGLLLAAVACGVMVHVCTVLVYYATAQAIGAGVSAQEIFFVGPLMIAATVGLPSIGGEGVREFTLIGLLGRIGIPESSAFVLGHLGFWAGMLLSLVGGLLYLLRPADYAVIIRSARAARTTEPAGAPAAAPAPALE
ncbi:MAG: flippase-like domain-containing protein [Anaerolineales bacterium]|nr:flippase-like domain-containing protein [Anaerolineales bacterium]